VVVVASVYSFIFSMIYIYIYTLKYSKSGEVADLFKMQ
jgi:hypothetical protein